jgi:hypothetical protein
MVFKNIEKGGFAQIIRFAQKILILHKKSFYTTLLYREKWD